MRVCTCQGTCSALLVGWAAGLAHAQPCAPRWEPRIGQPGMNNAVRALCVFDDGTGPALYAGGWFRSAGGVPANNIARWDGHSWHPVGHGFAPSVAALQVFDDGTGPALYAGGMFTATLGPNEVPVNGIAKWDGNSWSPLGAGVAGGGARPPQVRALCIFDDGTGPALYAGGNFAYTGGVPASRVAKWDGVPWAPLGSGIPGRPAS